MADVNQTGMLRRAPWLGLLLAGLALAACGGGEASDSQAAASIAVPSPDAGVNAVVVSTDLAVGSNRFTFGLLDANTAPIDNAQVHIRFFRPPVDAPKLASERDASFQAIETQFVHKHSDGSLHDHSEQRGVHLVPGAIFEQAGIWQAEMTITLADGRTVTVVQPFQVNQESFTPAVGAAAPASRQKVVSDVADIAEIDSSDPPDPTMHDLTIADAIAQEKPFVVAFATPAFCRSQICGPVMEVVRELRDEFSDEMNFIHIEPYDLNLLRTAGQFQVVDVVEEWGLQSEPWVFVVDQEGNIAAKFEGIVTRAELADAILAPLLMSQGLPAPCECTQGGSH